MATLLMSLAFGVLGVGIGWIAHARHGLMGHDVGIAGPTLRVVARTAMGWRRHLALVESAHRSWLIGLHPAGVTLLAEMEGASEDMPPPVGRSAFGRMLSRAVDSSENDEWKKRLDAAAKRAFGSSALIAEEDPLLALTRRVPTVIRHPPNGDKSQGV